MHSVTLEATENDDVTLKKKHTGGCRRFSGLFHTVYYHMQNEKR